MIGQTGSLGRDSIDKIFSTLLADLIDRGIQVTGDSIELNEESARILRNEHYGNSLYSK